LNPNSVLDKCGIDLQLTINVLKNHWNDSHIRLTHFVALQSLDCGIG